MLHENQTNENNYDGNTYTHMKYFVNYRTCR